MPGVAGAAGQLATTAVNFVAAPKPTFTIPPELQGALPDTVMVLAQTQDGQLLFQMEESPEALQAQGVPLQMVPEAEVASHRQAQLQAAQVAMQQLQTSGADKLGS